MSNAGYYFLRLLSWKAQFFPMSVHYFFSDILCFLIYHIVRYRRKVVAENLANAFPDKSDKERRLIEKKFYSHLCDTFIETIYFDRISPEEIKKRLKITNIERLMDYYNSGRNLIFSVGHYNNWEYLNSFPIFQKVNLYVIYKTLHSKGSDRFFYQMRNRFGGVPLEKSKTVRQLVTDTRAGKRSMIAILGDQTPKKNEIQYWTKFLNQDTPVLMGTEKIAKMIDAVIVGGHLHKVKRGYYELTYDILTDDPKSTAPNEITELHTRYLEKIIKEAPEYWLWSHRRWKHKKEA